MSVVVLSSCLLPPLETTPQYLSDREFQKVSNLSRAKELMLAGRFDDAELILRKEIKNSPNLALQYNDLGYLLYLEDRFQESELILQKAISLEPNFLAPKFNLARVMVSVNRYSEAITILDSIVDINQKISESEFIRANGVARTLGLSAKVERLKASALYLLGRYDEAVCSSYSAYQHTGTLEEASVHIRMLLSLESLGSALELLRGAVIVHKEALPTNILFDYALALVANSESELAKIVLDQVLGSSGLSQEEIAASRLLRFSLESQEADSLLIKESLLDDASAPCKVKHFNSKGYWPDKTYQLVNKAYMEVCSTNEA